jgi:hypothetical protein
MDWSRGMRWRARVEPAKAPAVVPITVMPTWTVARKRSGLFLNAWADRAQGTPRSTNSMSWVLRIETMAISAPERMPFRRIRIAMTLASRRMGPPGMEGT